MAPSVAIAARVLDLLAHSTPQAGLTEIARALRVNKSTCFNVLQTLARFGLVVRIGDSALYRLGPKLVDLGTAVRRNLSYRAQLREHLGTLAVEAGVGCVVGQMLGDNSGYVIMDRIAPPVEDGVAPPVGFTYPITAPAIGRAALSCLDEEEALDLVRRVLGIAAEIDFGRWRRDLAQIRRDGYAVSLEAYRKAVNAVAAPVRWSGEPLTVIAMVGSAAKLPETSVPEFGARLRAIARILESHEFGGQPSPPEA